MLIIDKKKSKSDAISPSLFTLFTNLFAEGGGIEPPVR